MFCMFKTASIAHKNIYRRFPLLSQNIRNIAGKAVNEEELQQLHEMHKKAVGYNDSGNTAMAAPLLKTLAEKKYTPTIAYLGELAFEQGKMKEAVSHFQFCANQEPNMYDRECIGESCCFVAQCYLEGIHGFRKDLREGSKLLQKAVDLGEFEAMVIFGLLLLKGAIGFAKNEDRGVELLKIASNGGNTLAQHYLGSVYYKGNSVLKKNMDLCIEYWKIAAEKEFPLALFELGMLYYDGHQDGIWHIPKDTALAASYLRKFLKLSQFVDEFTLKARVAQRAVNELPKEPTTKKRK